MANTSGFNSDRTIRQYAHGLMLESSFVPSGTNRWAALAKKVILVAVEAKPEVEIWRRLPVVKVDRRIRWHYKAKVLVHGSTKYRNCVVRSHCQPACWWHQPVLCTGPLLPLATPKIKLFDTGFLFIPSVFWPTVLLVAPLAHCHLSVTFGIVVKRYAMAHVALHWYSNGLKLQFTF